MLKICLVKVMQSKYQEHGAQHRKSLKKQQVDFVYKIANNSQILLTAATILLKH